MCFGQKLTSANIDRRRVTDCVCVYVCEAAGAVAPKQAFATIPQYTHPEYVFKYFLRILSRATKGKKQSPTERK